MQSYANLSTSAHKLWAEGGLINRSLGMMCDILYEEFVWPLALPLEVMVEFGDFFLAPL